MDNENKTENGEKRKTAVEIIREKERERQLKNKAAREAADFKRGISRITTI